MGCTIALVWCVPRKPHTQRRLATKKFNNILVPVDFSPAAIAALQYAIELARPGRAKITLLHVIAPSDGADLDGATQAARRQLEEVRKNEAAPSDRISLQVQTGIPFVEITERAAGDGADLIVLGRGHPGAAVQWANGHTSERVVRYAACPVLLLKEPETPVSAG